MMAESSGNGFSVGLGLTNDCNLACAHCHRDTGRIDCLSLDDVRSVAIARRVESIVCHSMTFGAFAKVCRFDR